MKSKLNEQEILDILTEKTGDLSERVTYDDRNCLTRINLSRLNLFQLPPELGQLSNLQQLSLDRNQLSQRSAS